MKTLNELVLGSLEGVHTNGGWSGLVHHFHELNCLLRSKHSSDVSDEFLGVSKVNLKQLSQLTLKTFLSLLRALILLTFQLSQILNHLINPFPLSPTVGQKHLLLDLLINPGRQNFLFFGLLFNI